MSKSVSVRTVGRRVSINVLVAAAVILGTVAPAAAQQLVHRSTFDDGATTGWSLPRITTHAPSGRVVLGPFTNESVDLHLSLPSHSEVTLKFRLHINGGWDGNLNSCCGSDLFGVFANGARLLETTFSNTASAQGYPDPRRAALFPAQTGADAVYGNGDSSYILSMRVAHTASTLQLRFTGSNLTDESWSLDDVEVISEVRPPTTMGWGLNSGAQLGHGTFIPSAIVLSPAPSLPIDGVVSVTTGQLFAAALTASGDVWTWGVGGSGGTRYGWLGDGEGVSLRPFPKKVSIDRVIAVSAGSLHTLALRADGTVWGWGSNDNYQLAQASTTANYVSPVPVPGLSNIVAIAAGRFHSLALGRDGSVYGWGFNSLGEAGIDTAGTYIMTPTLVMTGARNIVSGPASRHSHAVLLDGTVVSWGSGAGGQLGDGTTSSSKTPRPILGLTQVRRIATGAGQSYAILTDGVVMGWGSAGTGWLGPGYTGSHSVPVVLDVPRLVEIAATDHVLGIDESGAVWTWGNGDSGQIGDGYIYHYLITPRKVIAGDARTVSAGFGFSLALLGDLDADGDAVPDEDDNCPVNANPNQEDYDLNGIGDKCDVNAPPVAVLTATVDGLTVKASSFGSSDPDGVIAEYAWDFDYRGTFNPTAFGGTDLPDTYLSHTYMTAGTYVVALRVTDRAGGMTTATKTLTVGQLPTALSLSASPAVYGGFVFLSARLLAGSTPLEGYSIRFTLASGATATATTLSSGVASANIAVTGINAGTHITATAEFDGDVGFTPSSATANVVVGKATPKITWPMPAPIVYGTPLSSAQLNATANTEGTFTYFPPMGTILGAATRALEVSFVPLDTQNYLPASASSSIVITRAPSNLRDLAASRTTVEVGQGVTFTAAIDAFSYQDDGRQVSFLNDGQVNVANTIGGRAALTRAFVTPGTYTVSAKFPGSTNFEPSEAGSVTVTVIPSTRRYTIVELGNFGGSFSIAYDINSAGDVVGTGSPASGFARPFIYKDGILRELPTLGGAANAIALNDKGVVVGSSQTATGVSRAVAWENGVIRDLGVTGTYSEALDVNESGDIVGTFIAGGSRGAFLYRNGIVQNVSIGANSFARGVFDDGTVLVGDFGTTGPRTVLRAPDGTVREIGGPNSPFMGVDAVRVEGAGSVVGSSSAPGFNMGFRYSGGSMMSLGPVLEQLRPSDTNQHGDVVGFSQWRFPLSFEQRATLLTGGLVTDLTTVLPAGTGWILNDAQGINAAGAIVGVGMLAGKTRGFLLIPRAATSLSVASVSAPEGTSVTLTAFLKEGGTGIAGRSVRLSINGAVKGTVVTDASGRAELAGISVAGIPLGTFPTAIGADFTGDAYYLESAATGSLSITDGTPPVISITRPSAGALYRVGEAATAVFTCTDAGSGIASCTATDEGALQTAVAGTRTLTVTAIDYAGNVATASVPYSVADVALIPPTRIYVAGWQTGDVAVYDGTTHELIARVPVRSAPGAMAFNREGTQLFVAERASASVATIDVASLEVTGRAQVGNAPWAIAQTYDGKALYVANFDDGTVTVLRSNEEPKTLPSGPQPTSVLASPDNRYMLVANWGGNTISVFDADTDLLVRTLTIDGNAAHLAASPDGTRIIVSSPSNRRIITLDATTLDSVAAFDAHGALPTWAAFSPDGKELYVSDPLPGGSVIRMDSHTGTLIASLDPGGAYPGEPVVSPHGLRAYVKSAGNGALNVYDPASNTKLASIDVGLGDGRVLVSRIEAGVEVSETTAPYRSAATLRARVSSFGHPVAGRHVQFRIKGEVVGQAVSDAAGVATLAVTLPDIAPASDGTAGTPKEEVGSTGGTKEKPSEDPLVDPAPIDLTPRVSAFFFGDAFYTHATGFARLTIVKATPTVTVADAAVTYDGQPHHAVVSVTGVGGATLAVTSIYYNDVTKIPVDAGTYQVRATFGGNAYYKATDGTGTLIIDKARPTLSWTQPHSIIYGAPLGPTHLNALSDIPGSFTYDRAAGEILPAGDHSLTATFTPADALNYESGGTVTVFLTVEKAEPSVVVHDLNVVYDGRPHSASIVVRGPTGEILTGVIPTYNGVTNLPVSAGSYLVRALYAGDENHYAAVGTGTVVIAKAATALSMAVPAAAVFGEVIGVSAHLTASINAEPSLTVRWIVDGAAFVSTTSQFGDAPVRAALTGLAVGPHVVEAVFDGTADLLGSRSEPSTVVVSKASTSLALTVSPNPSGYQEPVVLTALVAPVAPGAGAPSGTVEFLLDGAVLGSGGLSVVNGIPTATLTTSGIPSGLHTITARYVGDETFVGSPSVAVSHTVNSRAESTTTELIAPSSAAIGSAVSLEAVVSTTSGNAAIAGSVEFSDGTTVLGHATLGVSGGKTRATFVLAFESAGVRQLRARYVPTNSLAASSSTPMSVTIYDPAGAEPATTAITLQISRQIRAGETAIANVTVRAQNDRPGGVVDLYVDGALAGSLNLINGAGTFSFVGLPEGRHRVMAVYGGAPGYSGSTSSESVTVVR